jgi:PAS domain S-box-containing protein
MKTDYHRLLSRQLKKAGLEIKDIPESMLEIISQNYQSYDEHITRLNRIIEINEKELQQKNDLIHEIQEKEFESVLGHLPGLVMWFSIDMTYLGANDNFLKLVGFPREQVVGKTISTVFAGKNLSFTERLGSFSASHTDEESFEFVFEGDGFSKNIVVHLQKFEKGEKVIVMGIDTTETIMLQQELEDGRAIVTHNARLISLGEMSATIAHEISNPLSILSGNLALLKIGTKEPVLIERIDRCENSLTRIVSILTNIKLLSRNTQNDQMEIVSLQNIVKNSLELIYQKTQQRSIKITLSFQDDYHVDCHISELIQVFHNMLNNAVDAIESLTEQWLKIEAHLVDTTIILKIIDSGSGIEEKVLAKLFEPFFTTKPIGKGTGLGMGISTKIIKKHGGILYYDKTNQNTCFVIELPLAQKSK